MVLNHGRNAFTWFTKTANENENTLIAVKLPLTRSGRRLKSVKLASLGRPYSFGRAHSGDDDGDDK